VTLAREIRPPKGAAPKYTRKKLKKNLPQRKREKIQRRPVDDSRGTEIKIKIHRNHISILVHSIRGNKNGQGCKRGEIEKPTKISAKKRLEKHK
jgi:hypothetical protein